jgi:preprotein translocase subunit SecA
LSEINTLEFASFTDWQLKEMSRELIKKARNSGNTDHIIVEAFGIAREAAKRVLGMKPFDVQVIAAAAMHYGKLVEMQTGEGKTLAAYSLHTECLTRKGCAYTDF